MNFVNRKFHKEQLLSFLHQKQHDADNEPRMIQTLTLDMSMVNSVDVSGLNMLKSVTKAFKSKKVQILLAGIRGPVRKIFYKSKFSDEVGMEHWFVDVQSAIDYVSTQQQATNSHGITPHRTSSQSLHYSQIREDVSNENKKYNKIEFKTTSQQQTDGGTSRVCVGNDEEKISGVCEEVSRFNKREGMCSFRGESIVSI